MGLKVHLSTGSTPVFEDIRGLREGPQIVVGTPGRVLDMITRGNLSLSYLKQLIFDEADEMLGTGFLEQVNEIMKAVPSDTQICLFSATIGPELIEMTKQIMNDPVKILV